MREESAKAFKKLKVKAPKSKKIELKTPSNPPIGKMEQISKIDDKKNLYIQRMDEKMAKNVSQSKGNSKSWRVRTYQPRKGTEIYIVGNAYIAIADSKPLIIKSFNPSDWKEK